MATFKNGRKYFYAVFDLIEARQIFDFCESQHIPVTRFLRVAALKFLEEQTGSVEETAVNPDARVVTPIPADPEKIVPRKDNTIE